MESSKNIYINHCPQLAAIQFDNSLHSGSDPTKQTNLCQEAEYIEIDVVKPGNKKQESTIQKLTKTRFKTFFILSISVALIGISVGCVALVKVTSLDTTSASIRLGAEIKQINESMNNNEKKYSKSINDLEKNFNTFTDHTQNEVEKLDKTTQEIQQNISAFNKNTGDEIENIMKRLSNMQQDVKKNLNDVTVLKQHVQTVQSDISDANSEIAQIKAILNLSYIQLEDEWISPFNGFQYKLINESRPWNESRKICQKWNSDLIVYGIRDAETRNSLLRGLSLGSEDYFIGAHDQDGDGYFTWVNGDLLPSNDSLWDFTEPNGSGDCCRARFDRETKLIFDGPCYDKKIHRFFAVCEKKI